MSIDLALCLAFGLGLSPVDRALLATLAFGSAFALGFAFAFCFALAFGLPLGGSASDCKSSAESSGFHVLRSGSLANRPLASLYCCRRMGPYDGPPCGGTSAGRSSGRSMVLSGISLGARLGARLGGSRIVVATEGDTDGGRRMLDDRLGPAREIVLASDAARLCAFLPTGAATASITAYHQ